MRNGPITFYGDRMAWAELLRLLDKRNRDYMREDTRSAVLSQFITDTNAQLRAEGKQS